LKQAIYIITFAQVSDDLVEEVIDNAGMHIKAAYQSLNQLREAGPEDKYCHTMVAREWLRN
jgi:hypothetical protein